MILDQFKIFFSIGYSTNLKFWKDWNVLLLLLESLQWVGFLGGEFVIFKTKMGEILNSECISWLETNLEFKIISIIKVRFTFGATQHESCIHIWANYTHHTKMY